MSEPQNKLPRARPGPLAKTGPRLSTPDSFPSGPPPSGAGQHLKVVTVSPGSVSLSTGDPPATPSKKPKPDPYLGATVDERYKVEAILGEGGMGVVYRCTHTIIGKKVAMKVLRSDLAADSEVTERFLNEAKAASAIGNPHIIDISDFGQFPDGSTYFIMEHLAGTPLTDVLQGSPVPLPRILGIGRQLTEGLAAAHEAGIVHRDLKPDNIFLISRGSTSDFVKILDFGIAKVSTAGAGRLTRAGAVFGTPHYMSPEQAGGTAVDHRGDVYSLGVILYEMATGKVPFDADNLMGILTQHLYKAPASVRSTAPRADDVPPGLEAVILKCLLKKPDDRYQTMLELGADLERLERGEAPMAIADMMARSDDLDIPTEFFEQALAAESPGLMAEPPPPRRRWPLALGLVGAVCLAGALFAFTRTPEPEPASPAARAVVPAKEPVADPIPEPPAALPPEPVGAQVVLAVEPLDAEVWLGTKDLGKSPVMLEVPDDEELELTIRRKGYVEQQVKVDGSEGRRVVKLDRAFAGRTAPAPRPQVKAKPPAPKPSAKPKLGGGEIVNPWD